MVEIAIFPIPNSVNFPGVPCPLHVFEPRYRQMVKHCIDNNIMMGVCHTEKTIRENTKQQTREEALSSNQSTYKPYSIFTAGKVELVEELPDGRMAITVHMSDRFSLVKETQTLPFSIWQCEPLQDESVSDEALAELEQTQQKILQRLITITHANPEAQAMLNSDYWQTMPAIKFSFTVNGLLALGPELMQQQLEVTNPQARVDQILSMLNDA